MRESISVNKFLRSLACLNPDNAGNGYISYFVKRGASWRRVLDEAESEGVNGLLFHHMRRMNLLDALPPPICRKLEDSYKAVVRRNLDHMACLISIEQIIKADGIRAIVLQGLSLLKIYGDPGLRPMSDMDLLVKPEQAEIMISSLKQIGFKVQFPDKADLLIKDDVLLDIHTHPLNIDRIRSRKNIFPEDITRFWERASPFSNAGESLLCMDMFDSFLCLSAHALKHCYSRLIWLCDLKELLHRILEDKNGWNVLIKRSESCGQKRILVYSLLMLEQVYEIVVPPKVKRTLNCSRTSIIEKRILSLMADGTKFETAYVILWLFSINGYMNKVRFLKETFLPRRAIMASMVKKKPVNIVISDYCGRLLYLSRKIGRELSVILKG